MGHRIMSERKVVKARLRGMGEQYKDKRAGSCVVPISVGQLYHEGDKFLATMRTIDRRFTKATILVCDTLQRYTIAANTGISLEQALVESKKQGAAWLQRNQAAIDTLSIPHEILHWDHWRLHSGFPEAKAKVEQLIAENPEVKQKFTQTVDEFCARFLKRNPGAWVTDRFKQMSYEYLVEEAILSLLWLESDYEFEVYPCNNNIALWEVRKQLIDPIRPGLFARVGVTFEKAGVLL